MSAIIQGDLKATSSRILVTDMEFGEQKTDSGIVIASDDGKTRGIYPRWAKVSDIGSDVDCEFKAGDWICIEHGRWTRAVKANGTDGVKDYRMVDADAVIMFSHEKPKSLNIGAEYADGEHATIDPSDFENYQLSE